MRTAQRDKSSFRLFRLDAEDEMPLQVVVDTSRSMEFGEKFPTAQRLAAMVSYLALISGERIRLATVPEPGSASLIGPWARHVSSWPKLESWLEVLEPEGGTDLVAASKIIASTVSRGPVILISDLMQQRWENAIDLFGAARGGVVLHVLSPAELDPDLTGDLTLRDTETRAEVPVSMSGDALERYQERMQRFVGDAFGHVVARIASFERDRAGFILRQAQIVERNFIGFRNGAELRRRGHRVRKHDCCGN